MDKSKTIKIPSKSFLFDHCIYALQIEDRRILNSIHSHRSIYDIYKLDCKESLTIENIKKDIYIKHFFLTIEKFKIFNINIASSLSISFMDQLFEFVNIKRYKFSQIIINYYNKVFIIIQLFFNIKLRKHALKKISIHYHHKTLLKYIYGWLKA